MAPLVRIEVDRVDLAVAAAGVLVATWAERREADHATALLGDPGQHVLVRPAAQVLRPHGGAASGVEAGKELVRDDAGVRVLPRSHVDLGDGRRVRDRGQPDGHLVGLLHMVTMP